MRIIALFPGQGSQMVGMGKDLYDQYPLAREMFAAADDALGFSISKICFEGREEQLTLTEIVQPAILTVSSICFRLAESMLGEHLDIVSAAGHSLGEYSALTAANALNFSDAVALVHKRGKFMQKAVPLGKGKMVAVLRKELEEVEEVINQINGTVEIANINAPGQIVVAGEKNAINQLMEKMSDARLVELQVSAPFHCSLMSPAADELTGELNQVNISNSRFPVYANYSAAPARSSQQIREDLTNQVCGRVRWVECVKNAVAESTPEIAVEFGAGNVLLGLLKRIEKDLTRSSVGSVSSLEDFVKHVSAQAAAA